MNTTRPASAPDPALLAKPLSRALRPLVRLLIRSGFTFPALCDLLRELYVNVAEQEFALPGKPQTDSRVSLLTGIHRKEVNRLRGAGASLGATPLSLSWTSRIMARWRGGPPFSDPEGVPLPLRRASPDEASFEALVEAVTRDVRPRSVLDEWLDRGLAILDASGRVVLRPAAEVSRPGERPVDRLGRNIHDHLAAAVENLSCQRPIFFEQAVHQDGLSEAAVQRLDDRSRALATSALQAADLDAVGLGEADPGGPWRWTFGIYIYRQAELPLASAELTQKSGRG